MIAKVIVDIASSTLDKVFDYEVGDLVARRGYRVLVPFGNRQIEGYIIEITDKTDIDKSKLKKITKVVDGFEVITEEQFSIAEFMIKKYHIGYADSLRLFLPSEMRSGKVKELKERILKVTDLKKAEEFLQNIKANAKAQKGALEYMISCGSDSLTSLNEKFGAGAVKRLIDLDILDLTEVTKLRKPYKELSETVNDGIILTEVQKQVIQEVTDGKSQTFLLHGVTGSGKTEVYMRVIQRVLAGGKTAIMLVPEISLTPQVLSSFRNRFGETVAIIHSGLSAGERYDEWKKILSGKVKIVVGARSAIFVPLKKIGIIIIDEEHDQSYISESHPRYSTVEVAKERQRQEGCNMLLGSATPSIDSYHLAVNGEYKLIQMPDRINNQPMPPLKIVDMCMEIRNGNTGVFSVALKTSLEKCINEGNQAIIFINRRGFTSFLMCRECGWVAKCSSCDVSLVYHKHDNVLKCHYCGNRFKAINVCPNCKSEHLKQGAVGTQKVVAELEKLFPGVKILRMDNDTTGNKDGHLKITEAFRKGKAQILVGTQMVAKGHDFPRVTVVGIVDADQSLYHSSYKSTEKTFQLITQVAGRAGRAERAGEIILQTYSPKHYVYRLVCSYDYTSFYRKEINLRQLTQYPPFSKIIRILFTSDHEELAKEATKVYYNEVVNLSKRYEKDFLKLSVMKSPIGKIQNKYRYQILIRLGLSRFEEIKDELFNILNMQKTPKTSVFIEINPQNLS